MKSFSQKLPIGWVAPDFSLTGTDGQTYALSTFAAFPALVIVFTANECVQSRASWSELNNLQTKYGEELALVAINSQDRTQLPLEGPEEMQGLVVKENVLFPYLVDESSAVARAYQVQCLPEPFLLKNVGGNQWQLFYHGRLGANGLDSAVLRLLSHQDPPALQHAAAGCTPVWQGPQ